MVCYNVIKLSLIHLERLSIIPQSFCAARHFDPTRNKWNKKQIKTHQSQTPKEHKISVHSLHNKVGEVL